MQSRVVIGVAAGAMLAALAGCTSSGGGAEGLKAGLEQPDVQTPIVRGTCPKVELREGTESYRTYAKGGSKDKDPSKVVNQASLSKTTRQCTVSGDQLVMEVAAAGRLVAGPAGGPGTVTMPIRVAAVDGQNNVLYSQLTQYKAELPQGSATTQFLFSKPSVAIPLDQANAVRVFVGFDEGPYDTP